jgi:4-hydroxybenzoate polyprenyltransferase
MERFRHLLSALWLTVTGLTLAQINALLGFISLLIGISYQLWKWKREAAKE